MPSRIFDPKEGRKVSGPPSKESMRLAKKIAEQKDWMKTATPEEKAAWAERLAQDFVAAGEAEYGPDYRKKR